MLKSLFQVVDLVNVQESVPKYLSYFAIYRFPCPGYNTSYIGETIRYLTTTIKEHLEDDSKTHIFKHVCRDRNFEELCDTECFEIIHSTTSSQRLKLTIVEQTSKACKYFYNPLNIFFNCLCPFTYLFYCYPYCFRYQDRTALTPLQITPFYFYKQPIYKQLVVGTYNHEQLPVLNIVSISIFLKTEMKKIKTTADNPI